MEINLKTGKEIPEIENIAECIKNILSIPAGSIPLARELGLKWSILSQIPPDLENDYATEIITKVERYEPRVLVREVAFEYKEGGEVKVNIVLKEGVKNGGR